MCCKEEWRKGRTEESRKGDKEKEKRKGGKEERKKEERGKKKRPKVDLECGPAQPSLFSLYIPLSNLFGSGYSLTSFPEIC